MNKSSQSINDQDDTEKFLFNREAYLQKYPDVKILGMDPWQHYIKIGKKLGRIINPDIDSNFLDQKIENINSSFDSFGIIDHNPLISIIIISYNSGKDLNILFKSIIDQTYVNYEIILLENGTEDTEKLFREFFPNGVFHKADNVGFAEGNNIALHLSKGEFIALINPDTRLVPDTLQKLLESLRFDESAAVAVPKIYFFERFVHMRIRANAPFSIERSQILKGLHYQKIFVHDGTTAEEKLHSDRDGLLTLDLPYEGHRIVDISLKSDMPLTSCEAQINFAPIERTRQNPSETLNFRFEFNAENCANASYIVNNAGSSLHPDGMPFDRGYGQFDDGAFYGKAYVNALCGCAALIRRSTILKRNLFFGPMFAYFEDSELSHWLIKQNYRILYQPAAQIFHRHSESTEEHSLSWNVLVSRSKQLYKIITQDPAADLSGFSVNYPKEFSGTLRNKLEAFDSKIREAGSYQSLMAPPRPTACVYNSYFSSMGGGEKHALDIAELLSADFDVYLASETDFDLQELEDYFSVDLSRTRKIISKKVDTYFTSNFDLFVNSTFLSQLRPSAKENIYIVSFPQEEINRNILYNYRFLHNSTFTKSWADNYWGEHKMNVVLPILGKSNIPHEASSKKKNEIISVGRFTYDGHCKNHHIILKSFKELVDSKKISDDWSLKIIGSCDFSQNNSTKYYNDLIDQAYGYNVSIIANADRQNLDKAYVEAAIYVHAAGLQAPANRPELHEHFGITTFEAMANGCIPVVYYLGGPAEQIEGLQSGKVFEDFDSLKSAILMAVTDFERNSDHDDLIRSHAASMQSTNANSFQEVLKIILEDIKKN